LAGTQIEKWAVGQKIIKYGYMPYYSCTCACGKQSLVDGFSLSKGTSKGCLKCGQWTGFGELPGKTWKSIYSGAAIRDIEISITIEDAWNLFVKQGKRCALTGLPIRFRYRKDSDNPVAIASLDRIDSTKGYVAGNVQWVHKDINIMKQSFGNSHFVELCKLVATNFSRLN